VVVVNEAYPPNCIRYHFGDFTVSSDPQHYRVEGHELAIIASQSPNPAESSSNTSLQLKAEEAPRLPPQETPSRTGSSEQRPFVLTSDDHAPITVDPSRSSPLTLPTYPQNALKEAIEEAKAIQYLVSLLRY